MDARRARKDKSSPLCDALDSESINCKEHSSQVETALCLDPYSYYEDPHTLAVATATPMTRRSTYAFLQRCYFALHSCSNGTPSK